MANYYIAVDINSYEKVKTFKYLGALMTHQNSIQDEVKCRFKAENPRYWPKHTCLLDFASIN